MLGYEREESGPVVVADRVQTMASCGSSKGLFIVAYLGIEVTHKDEHVMPGYLTDFLL